MGKISGKKRGFLPLTDFDFSFQICKTFDLFLFGCFVVNIHGRGNIRMAHDLLNDFQIRFIFAKSGAESMPQIMG